MVFANVHARLLEFSSMHGVPPPATINFCNFTFETEFFIEKV